MAEVVDLSVAEARARIAATELSAAEYFAAWHRAALGDDLGAYLFHAKSPPPLQPIDGPLGGVPVAVK
ncbi:MAG: hypothetical protein ACM3NV_08965, partial [Syntrophothermus sp.]